MGTSDSSIAEAATAGSHSLRMLVVSSDNYPPTRVDVAVLFGEELAARGHRIDWILQSEGPCSRSYVAEWGGGKVWVGATDTGPSLFSSVRRHLSGIIHDLKLFSRLRSGEYQVIEVKDKFLSGIFAVIAARRYNTKFVYWLSYPFPEEYLYRAQEPDSGHPVLYRVRGLVFKYLLYRVLLPAADHIFVQSEQMLRDVAAQGISKARMTAVPMGVKLGNASSATAGRTVIPADVRCFLYLGTLARVRRMDFLIRVLAHVLEKMPGVKLYLVGRGNDAFDEKVLVDEANRLGVLPAVLFVGQLPQAEAMKYVQDADVCVSPFYPTPVLNSTSPTKLVEYMAMGKAVVANDHPEQRLVIEQSGAGYCVPYDEKAFADAVLKLLNEPEVSREMGNRGRRYVVEHRTYGTIADAVESDFLKVVDARRNEA